MKDDIMIYNYICTHSLPEEIKIVVEADNQEDALNIVTDELFTQFELSKNIDRDWRCAPSDLKRTGLYQKRGNNS